MYVQPLRFRQGSTRQTHALHPRETAKRMPQLLPRAFLPA
jgi:hypothetical protein